MNQEALTAAHKHFTDTGYDGDLAKFSALLSSNKEAFNASFNYFKETGYDGDEAKFSNLLGLTSTTTQEDFPVEPEEVKEDPSREDVTVEGEDGASTGEDDSSVTPEQQDAIDVLTEIQNERLTKEEEAESDLMASEILAESQVDIDEGPEQVVNPEYAINEDKPYLLQDAVAGTVDKEQNIFQEGSFFPNEDLLVSTQDQTTDVVKSEVESKEKTRRKTKEGQLKDARKKLELINNSLPEDKRTEITDEDVLEEAKKTSKKEIDTGKRVKKLEDNIEYAEVLDPSTWGKNWLMKDADQKKKEETAKIMAAKVEDDIKKNLLVNKEAKRRIDEIKLKSEEIKNNKEFLKAEKAVKKAKEAYEANPTEETQSAYVEAYDVYKAKGDELNLQYQEYSKAYDEQLGVFNSTIAKHEELVKTDEDLNIYLEAYGRNNSLLWGHTFGKLAVTLGDMGVNALELQDKLRLPNLIKLGMSVVEDGFGYDLGANGDALEAGITYYMEEVLPNMGLKTSTDQRIQMRAYLEQARNGLAKAPTFAEVNGLGDFGSYMADLAFNQAPNLAMMYYTGGASLYAMGAITAGGKFGEFEDEIDKYGTEYSLLQMYTAAAITGTTEALSEMITLGQIGRFKTALASNPSLRLGVSDYLTKQLFSASGIANTLSQAGQEAVSEMAASLSENAVDKYMMGKDVDMLRGVSEAGWSGFWMSTMMFKAPIVARDLYKAIEGKDANQKIGEKQTRLKELGVLLNNPDLAPGLKEKYIAEHQKVVKDINSIQQDEISKLDEMSNTEKKTILDIARQKYDLRKQQDEIANSNLDAETKASEIQNIKNEISKLDVKKNELMAPYYLEDTIDEIRIQADAIGGATGKTAKVTPMNAEEIAESLLAEQARIREEIAYQEQFLGTQDDAMAKGNIEYFENELAALEQADNQFGYISPQEDGGFEVIINKDKPMMGTAAHELMHAVLFKSIQQDPSIQDVMGDALMDHVASLGGNSSVIGRRMEAYGRWAKDKDGNDIFVRDSNFGEEAITVISEGIYDGTLDYNESFFNKVGNVVRRTLQDKLGRKVSFNTGRDVYNFIKDFNKSLKDKKVNKAIIRTAAEGAGGRLVENKTAVEATKQMSKDARAKTPEQLVKTIKRGGNPRQVAAAEDVLVPQYQALALEALGYTEAKGDILRKNVVSAVNDYYDAIVRNYDPKKGKFSTHVYNNIAPKNDTIFEKAKTLAKRDESVSMDAAEARQVAGDAGVTTNTQDTFVQKIDILGFATVGRVADKIKSLVKVKPGDNFKSIISRYAGKVGELVFDIPAKKIMEGGANLAAVTKYKEGMPAPAEAQNIQRFFNAGQNADRFIKTLPLYNVTDKNADIDKVGENIDVSRNAYGIAIGLKGLPLDYFYENYTDPKSISKDPKVRAESITSPAGRSKGLTSQTQVKRLKPEFRNPTPEVVEQFKKDIGITPKGQENVYNRDIGQLLKGAAKVYSINASLSAAQRAQEAKLKAAPVTEQKAIKQQTADITAAQSKIAFSKNNEVDVDILNEGVVEQEFEMDDITHIDKLLEINGKKGIFRHRTSKEIDGWFDAFENDIIAKMPESVLPKSRLNTILRPSKRIFAGKKFGLEGKGQDKIIVTDGKYKGQEMTIDNYYNIKRKELLAKDLKYGPPFKGEGAKYVYGKTYASLFGRTESEIKKSFKNGTVEAQNKINLSMHKQMWDRINKSIKDTKGESLRSWGSWLSMVGQDTEHPHRMGAELVGYSPNPKGVKNKKGKVKLFEWEHAMPATRAYLYLLHNAADKNLDFNTSYGLVSNNFKLIALDAAQDLKLKSAGRTTSMGQGWSIITDSWLDRYFKGDVGIDARSITGLDGRTFEDTYSIPRLKPNIAQNQMFSKAINNSRTVNPAKGITVLDFDDTLATSKSLVISTAPDAQNKIQAEADRLSRLTYQDYTDIGGETAPNTDIIGDRSAYSIANEDTSEYERKKRRWERDYAEKKEMREKKSEEYLQAYKDGNAETKREIEIDAGAIRKLTAEEFAQEGADLLDQGWTHDFSEFSKVVDGKVASLFNKAMKLQGKFGPQNMFVLTARPADSAPAIFEFLKANGLNIPLKNITGLANSTPESKALWIADKVAEGYNDFYFADDALQNVQAVDNMLEQFDVKRKVQQAKIQFSKSINTKFNDILESTTGVESIKEFSNAQAKLRGQKTKYKSIIPASAQDFQGLLYNFLGKGKKGEADMAFFKKALIDPFARGINELNASRQSAANDFENLNKKFPDVKKKLNDSIEGLDYTYDQAMRVYLWNKAGFEVPGLSKRDLAALTSIIENNPEMKVYADAIGLISKKEDGYSQPKDYWLAESIASDLLSDGAIGDKRSDFLAEWIENKNMIFSPENLNKIEAIYGSKFREALEDMLYRMETGRNRPMGGGRLVNGFMNWTNNSVGAIMFLNLRSATLQTISAVNYVNWDDNNPARAAAAFANQPQFWRDFSYIFNSDYLKQRRSGNQRGINEAELSEAVAGSDNKAKAAIAWLLKKGFTPTQIADSFAISMGGATFYRNRIKKYVKEGMTTEQAEKQAFLDLQETTEVNQQSARPDMISQQQASPLGRLILAFQNTPMQYARIMNKATRDLVNGRGDYRAHVSKIVYYGFVQSIIFGALQSALYASLGDDDEEDFGRKKERILNQMVDSWLTGIGYGGKAIGTMKNTIMEYFEQRDKGFNSDHAYTLLTLLSFSPPIGSKLRKIYSSIQTEEFNRGVFTKRGFTLDNPIWSGVGNVVEGLTNIPLGRMSNLMLQLDNAMDPAHKWWQRVALLLGQNTWDLGIKDPDIEAAKGEVKEEKKIESKKRAKIKKEQKKKEKEEENKAVIEDNKKKSKKDGICSAVSKSGKRCKTKVVDGKLFCTVHESTTKRSDGKEVQCRKRKSDGKRCKMKTTNKSGYCYYHD